MSKQEMKNRKHKLKRQKEKAILANLSEEQQLERKQMIRDKVKRKQAKIRAVSTAAKARKK